MITCKAGDHSCGRLSMNYGLLWGVVACSLGHLALHCRTQASSSEIT